jgi:2-C-methyl-D-erythritol 4-phosphate cytidylyltransferase
VTVWAIVVAAGRGARFGTAKQFEPLGGATVLDRAVGAAEAACPAGVVVVLPAGAAWAGRPGVRRVEGGATRSASVRAGLAQVPGDADVVVVHDAARPLAGPELFARVIEAVRAGADGAVPAVPVSDTLKRVDGDQIVETVARDGLYAVQTPQAFAAAALRRAHAARAEGTDDAALVEASGGRVVVVAGDPRNVKLTTAADLALVEALEARR